MAEINVTKEALNGVTIQPGNDYLVFYVGGVGIADWQVIGNAAFQVQVKGVRAMMALGFIPVPFPFNSPWMDSEQSYSTQPGVWGKKGRDGYGEMFHPQWHTLAGF